MDGKHQLIVEQKVTNDPRDHAHLAERALRAKETLGVEQIDQAKCQQLNSPVHP